ncbi:hypothetical protein [Bhargavaea ginsengi]|uniref:hypothetical protein n=1 Tax=Bhargavaea ginsengi TaxID=426757 RepID=UPI003C7784A3
MFIYLNLIILLVFSALISSIGGFLIDWLFHRLRVPRFIGTVSGALATLLLIRVILLFLDFRFYDAAIIGLAITFYILLVLHSYDILHIAWTGIALILIMVAGYIYIVAISI